MLDKTYEAAAIEPRIDAAWEAAGAFRAGAGRLEGQPAYTIVIPPPNVTGSLHMGHALNNTLQDILIRFERMRGKDVLWQPGMDHAGIATQMVVERQMMERQEPDRRTIGRDKFLEKVWAWKEESGGQIINQLKRLGCSCDWSRERFTMDEGLSRAVTKVFIDLYRAGLIYRDKRLVNWDPKLRTAISDLEVQPVETNGKLWHFKYPIEGEPGRFITVATTRPETMLGDTGVAVHPDDERYKDLVGRNAILPLVGRRLKIVADDYADPEAGSGAVKITPAHDFNDFEVGKRNDLAAINIMTENAEIALAGNEEFLAGLEPTPELEATIAALHGQDRLAARQRIVEQMEERGLLDRIEEHVHSVPHGDRGGVPIEPFLTDQWYVDAKTLAAPAMDSVRGGRTRFVPEHWEKTYFDWMENIQPWCISRQLWWGHQIPAWYGPESEERYQYHLNNRSTFVAANEADAKRDAEEKYGQEVVVCGDDDEFRRRLEVLVLNGGIGLIPILRDPDVLDTWFSSALWPFSTLGWPDETPELERYYPTSVLVTGFDIIFFWVARMMMMGLRFMETEPFHTVYIHALVRDEKGAKMSKSKGNVIDPIELVDAYGADALRFTLTAMAAQGRDIKLATNRVEGYRNFATKLWNATRFALMNECRPTASFAPADASQTLNRWILTEAGRTATAVTEAIEAYRFNEAAGAVYRFVWNSFCDWYLELAKPVFNGGDEAAKAETRATTAHVLELILKLLHPIMPFVTEELWAQTAAEGSPRGNVLALERWPEVAFADPDAAAEINWLIDLISEVRSVRAEMNVPPGAEVPLVVSGASSESAARLEQFGVEIRRLARAASIGTAAEPPSGAIQAVVGEAVVSLPLQGIIDFDEERARLQRELDKVKKEVERIDKKLGNAQFVAKAPDEVVEGEREKRAEAAGLAARIQSAIERLSV